MPTSELKVFAQERLGIADIGVVHDVGVVQVFGSILSDSEFGFPDLDSDEEQYIENMTAWHDHARENDLPGGALSSETFITRNREITGNHGELATRLTAYLETCSTEERDALEISAGVHWAALWERLQDLQPNPFGGAEPGVKLTRETGRTALHMAELSDISVPDLPYVFEYGPGVCGGRVRIREIADGISKTALLVNRRTFPSAVSVGMAHAMQVNPKVTATRDGMAETSRQILDLQASNPMAVRPDVVIASGIHHADPGDVEETFINTFAMAAEGSVLAIRDITEINDPTMTSGVEMLAFAEKVYGKPVHYAEPAQWRLDSPMIGPGIEAIFVKS